MIKKDCPFYPCHSVVEDCTYCYCPFYPCEVEGLGEYTSVGGVWDCSKCSLPHYTAFVTLFDMCTGNNLIPLSFHKGIEDCDNGDVVDLDTVIEKGKSHEQ